MNKQQMTLGDMIRMMKLFDPCVTSSLSMEWCSYRGRYSDLAVTFSEGRERPIGKIQEELEELVGATFTGWKGGEYSMNEDTPVWIAESGTASNIPLFPGEFFTALDPKLF